MAMDLKSRTEKQLKFMLSFKNRKKASCVCVLTDKMNFTRMIKIEDYKRLVSDHLQKVADLELR